MKLLMSIIAVVLLLIVVVVAGLWIAGGRTDVYEYEVTINALPEQVYPHLVEPQSLTKWISGLVESKPITEGGPRVGARSIETIEENGRRFTMETEVTGYEPNRLLEGRLTSDMMEVIAVYQLQPQDGGTRLKHSTSADYKGVTRIFAPFLRGTVQSKLQGDLNRLKQLSETGQ